MNLPEITEVERLTLQPGDVLFIHVDRRLTTETAFALRERVQAMIGRDDVKVLILEPGMSVEVAGKAS